MIDGPVGDFRRPHRMTHDCILTIPHAVPSSSRRARTVAGCVRLAVGLLALASAHAALAFGFNDVAVRAKQLAAKPYQAPADTLPRELRELRYDQYREIRFKSDQAYWRKEKLPFELGFFHEGSYYDQPVKINEVSPAGVREIRFDPRLFDYGPVKLDPKQLRNLGFAGFRVHYPMNTPKYKDEVVVFLGASYFRGIGKGQVYGLSARGLAIDTALNSGEEFPRFTDFWIERPAAGAKELTIYALLNSRRATGAYRFVIKPGSDTVVDVKAQVYMRENVSKLAIAPLTSMFFFGENQPASALDFRPEVHDSDGLSVQSGTGEWIWRPLANPPKLRSQRFADDGPRGFGLLQRDRNPDHYQDDGVFYEKRPSVWVEPTHDWGEGAVELVELSANDETFDNIVAFWRPAVAPQAGQELAFGYRLTWGAQPAAASPLARVVATRTGIGGIVGQPRKYFSWRFVVDFAGGELARLGHSTAGATVEPVIRASRGRVEIASARPLASIDGVRAMFDVVPDASNAPIELQLTLQSGERLLSETWAYQWTPPVDRAV